MSFRPPVEWGRSLVEGVLTDRCIVAGPGVAVETDTGWTEGPPVQVETDCLFMERGGRSAVSRRGGLVVAEEGQYVVYLPAMLAVSTDSRVQYPADETGTLYDVVSVVLPGNQGFYTKVGLDPA